MLADALGESPTTIIAVHLLRTGQCRAWIAGPVQDYRAAIVQPSKLPEEPQGFGESAKYLYRLLKFVPGWTCFNVPVPLGRPIGKLISSERSVSVSYLDDLYHELAKPPTLVSHPLVRLLTPDDYDLLASAPERFRGEAFGDPADLLTEGFAAAAVDENRIVALAYTAAIGRQYCDLGVETEISYRKRGLGLAASSYVAREVVAGNRTAVWSCGATNAVSLRIANRLGFRHADTRTYVIPASVK